jgi:hypothetical protein
VGDAGATQSWKKMVAGNGLTSVVVTAFGVEVMVGRDSSTTVVEEVGGWRDGEAVVSPPRSREMGGRRTVPEGRKRSVAQRRRSPMSSWE